MAKEISDFNRRANDHLAIKSSLEQMIDAEVTQFHNDLSHTPNLLELLAVISLIGLGFSFAIRLEVFGVLILLCLSIFSMVALRRLSRNAARIRFWIQFFACLLLPSSSLLADPFFFAEMRQGRPIEFNRLFALPTYLVTFYFIAMLGISWLTRASSLIGLNAFIAGTFWAASLFFIMIGVVLLPAMIIGMLALIGLVGLVPWMAGMTYMKSASMHWRWSCYANNKRRWFFLVAGFGIPTILWLVLVGVAEGGGFDSFYKLFNASAV